MEAAAKKLPIEGEVFSVEGRTAFLIMPAKQKSGARTPWVWYAPTLPGLPGDAEIWMFERFLSAGIAIAGIDVSVDTASTVLVAPLALAHSGE